MIKDFEDWIRANVKCCACGGRLDASEVLNVYATKKVATWKHPISGSLERPDYPPTAVAFICEKCSINKKVKIRHVVEWEGTPRQVTYHDIDSLVDADEVMSKMKYYFGRKLGASSAARNKLMLKAARQEDVN